MFVCGLSGRLQGEGDMERPLLCVCVCVMVCAVGRSQSSLLCTQCCLSESSLEAVASGRAEYANVLADLGFIARTDAGLLGPARGGHKPTSKAMLLLPHYMSTYTRR